MTSSASAFAKLVTPSLSSRTVFVKCTPVPANFTERRAVLRSLYSSATEPDIEVFKKLEVSIIPSYFLDHGSLALSMSGC